MQTINIIVVDDHKIIREGMEAMLAGTEIQLIGSAATANELFVVLKEEVPDVVLLDLGLPGTSGLEVARMLNRDHKQIRVVVLTANNTEHNLISSVKAGVKGFLDKNCSRQELLEAIREVASGGVFFGRNVSSAVMESIHRAAKVVGDTELSDRELEVLKCFAEGLSYKETADSLNINVKTVESHKKNIFEKLEFSNNADLVKYAIREGIVDV